MQHQLLLNPHVVWIAMSKAIPPLVHTIVALKEPVIKRIPLNYLQLSYVSLLSSPLGRYAEVIMP